jgi:hypothetical protein
MFQTLATLALKACLALACPWLLFGDDDTE